MSFDDGRSRSNRATLKKPANHYRYNNLNVKYFGDEESGVNITAD